MFDLYNEFVKIKQNEAEDLLCTIIGQPLLFGIKSPDMLFFDFGFGDIVPAHFDAGAKWIGRYSLHADCRVKIIEIITGREWLFSSNDSNEFFQNSLINLINHRVKKFFIEERNNLRIEIGDYWIVCETWDGDEESWRYFEHYTDKAHCIGTSENLWLG